MQVDDQWLARLRRGDAAAYETLVDCFEGPLYRYFLVSHGDPQLAGEQSVDCFSELVQALPKMTGGVEQLRPFVFAVARNVLRRSWRRSQVGLVAVERVDELVDPRPSAAATIEHRDELDRLLGALRELDPITREVFLLRYVEQLSVADVAVMIGEPIGTIKSRVHRGRRKLKELLRTAEQP